MPDTTNNPSPAAARRLSKPLHLMTDDERLAALKEWAEEKKYIYPGEAGTFAASAHGHVATLVRGGPMLTVVNDDNRRRHNADRWAGQYDAPVGPPSYHGLVREEQVTRSTNPVKRWLLKRRRKKEAMADPQLPRYSA